LISVLPALLVAAVLAAPLEQRPASLEPQAQPPAAAPAAPTAPEVPGPIGPGSVVWATSTDEAHDRAEREGKFVFFEFTQAECGNCKRMDSLLYPAVDFEALLASSVPVKIDIESPEGKAIASRYSFEKAPAVLITTPQGRLVFMMEGFFNQPEFFRHANAGIDGYRKWARQIDAQNVATLPAKEAFDSGNELYHRSDPQAAVPRLKRAATAPGASAREREDALELLAAAELDSGQPAAARKTTEKLIATTKDRQRRERAELFRAQIPLAENRPAEALALFRKFQKDHPTSPHLTKVKELVARLQERVAKP
jgi:tetratricopeptide (TPR) repeat protein